MAHLYLIAQIAGRPVAIDSDQVESVVDIGEVTAVPRASGHVRGLAALRSRVVTVVDTQSALGFPTPSTAKRAVITRVEGHHYALLVDALDDVAPFATRDAGSSSATASRSWRSTSPRWSPPSRQQIDLSD
jgi:purine-binding chemotaxis protein CheW